MKHFYLNFYRFTLVVLAIASPYLLSAQDGIVRGSITDETTGEAIPGVNILIEGTTSGTVSDVEGNYQVNAPSGATLVFSSVGFVTQTVPVSGRSVIDISLAQDVQALSEVIVVGYGTQERARVTGAISSVSSEEISSMPVTSVDQALQGRAAGVTVANSGAPGVSPIVRIRGLGTLGDNNPLYVIDGVPSGGLNLINPNDIESVQILKDASAAAIYGSRAANGVVIITTKKGTKGKTQVTVDAYTGVQRAWKTLDLLNREQYLEYGRTMLGDSAPARFNNMNSPVYPGTDSDLTWNDIDTDWQDEMFRSARISDVNIGVSGGGENSIFNIGGGYFEQEGILLGTGFERYSFRANSEFDLGKFKFGETLTIGHSTTQSEAFSGGRTQIEHMIKMVPYIPVRDPDKQGGFRGTDGVDGTDPENPVLNAMLRENWNTNTKVLASAYGSYEIFEGLEYKITLGLDMNFGYTDIFTPQFAPSDSYSINQTADVDQTRNEYISPLVTNQLSFNKEFGKHSITADAVFERQTARFKSSGGYSETDLTSDIRYLAFYGAGTLRGDAWETALLSYLGRINYDFGGKYLLSASLRRDGGSQFGMGMKWGTFPAVSAGWRVSEEAFMQNVNAISELKLRGSWGRVGNNAIGNYRYQTIIEGGHNYVFGPGSGLAPGLTARSLANQQIQWETTNMINVGLDIGLFNESVRASIEYFNNETEDLLIDIPLAPSLGYDVAPPANVGSVVNKGFEATLGYYKNTGDLNWSLSGNISFVQNELTSLGAGGALEGGGFLQTGYNATYSEEGEPIGYFRGWVVEKIFQTDAEVAEANAGAGAGNFYQVEGTAPGDIKFKDLDGDGRITDADREKLGHYLPDFAYGINASVDYKNFDLSLFMQGVSGNEIVNVNGYNTEGMTRLFNAGTQVLDAWTPSNTNTSIPRNVSTDPNANARISSRFVEDGSYFRIKNLTIGYSLPSSVLSSFGNGFIKNIRLYVSSQNLLTITDYSGYDPEVGARTDLANQGGRQTTLNTGVDYGQYPQPRTFIGGIQLGF